MANTGLSSLLLLGVLCALAAAAPFHNALRAEFEAFKVAHNKEYKGETEDAFRFNIFMTNKQAIAEHNLRYYNKEVSYKMTVNQFTDMTEAEMETRNGFGMKSSHTVDLHRDLMKSSEKLLPLQYYNGEASIPESMDWRTKGAVTEVKNQLRCGSCWAFSATGALEGAYFVKTGNLTDLSEQNLLDCAFSDGCDGGFPSLGFQFVEIARGIDSEVAYPYIGVQHSTCKMSFERKALSGVSDMGYHVLPRGDEEALKKTVATVGPVSVAISATTDFMRYSEGVFECMTRTQMNHAVLVVGYGTDEATGRDYWLVKNSWGRRWGDHGYVKMARNHKNNCLIASEATVPLFK